MDRSLAAKCTVSKYGAEYFLYHLRALRVLRTFRSSALRLFLLTALLLPIAAHAASASPIAPLLKKNDACLVTAPDGHVLVSIHAGRLLAPASTLKLFTSLVGFHYLGPGYRFPTAIYLDDSGDLTVKGYGDPLMISEVLQKLAVAIRKHLPAGKATIRDLILDDTYFTSPLIIPGVSDSEQPYDAANGALCANFNTIAFKRRPDGRYVSGEAQTPLLPSELDRVRASGLKTGRIPLSHSREETTGYTGHLLAYFLRKAGVPVTGKIRFAPVNNRQSRLLFTFQSPYSLKEDISKLLEFSNNFMANQIFIAAGAKAFGPPGTLKKGLRAARAFAAEQLHLRDFEIAEGSGISRKNRVSARTMLMILKAFEPFHGLMRKDSVSYYKTGTLDGIENRVGFLKDGKGNLYPFVVLLNQSDGNMLKVMDRLPAIVLGRLTP